MSLVILSDNVANRLSAEIIDTLIRDLKNALATHQDGKECYKEIDELCHEISNIARQIKPKKTKLVEVNF